MRIGETKKPIWGASLALLLYLTLSLIYFGSLQDYSRVYLGWPGDPIFYIWCLNWWPWAIAHGLNPFVSYYVWYPHGFNMTWCNSVCNAALLMAPLTWLTNSVVSFNVLSLLAPALSAWTGFLLARYLTRDAFSAFIGGYLFGFSSYELGHMLGHLNLDLIFVVPLLVLLVVQRLRGDLSRPRFVAILAIALLVQLGLATEILATACVFGAITWVIFLAFATATERPRLWAVAWEIILATGFTVVLGTPFLFFVVKGVLDKTFQVNIVSPTDFSADLLNYVIPTEVTRLGHNFLPEVARRFEGNPAEQGAYLGLPLILILILQLRDVSRRPYLKPLMVSLLMMLVLSLGPSLHVAGLATNVWLPWQLALNLPLIHQALPTRFSMYVALAAALAAALWLSAARSRSDRARRFTLTALACLFLVPNRAMVRWTPLPLQPFFEPQNVTASLGHNANVVMLPYGYTGPSMIWQWQSGMSFTQSGGHVSPVPQWESVWPAVRNLYAGTGGPSFKNDIAAFCTTHEVSTILVGPGTPAPLAAAVSALHWQETMDHGVRVVRVPDPRFLHFHYVLGDYWPEEGPESWMGRQISIVTHGCPMQLRIIGRYRPSELGPVEIRVLNGSDASYYHITQQDTQLVNLPAYASVIVTASEVFVADRINHTGDQRPLSVRISLQPESGSNIAGP
jgi:hypothetical protein